jgi:hypothetical protein
MSETANKSSTMAVAGCVAMIGIAWAARDHLRVHQHPQWRSSNH